MDHELLDSAHDVKTALDRVIHGVTVLQAAASSVDDGYCLYTRDAVVVMNGRILDDLLHRVRFLLEDIDRLTPKESD